MKAVFTAAGVIFILGAVLCAAVLASALGLWVILIAFCLAISGLALLALADTMQKVEFLQQKLNLYMESEREDALPQKICAKCGASFDFDCPKCPRCGNMEVEI